MFLTRDRGKKRGVAKNARQSRRRFGGALEPLTYGRVGVRRARAAGPGAAGLRRAAAVAAVGDRRRGARLRQLLRRADRRVGAGGGSERDAVPAGRVDDRRDRRGRADRAAGALLRVLAAAAAGRVRGRSAAVGRGAGVPDRGAQLEPVRAGARRGVARRAAGAGSLASRADRDASGEGPEIGARVARDASTDDISKPDSEAVRVLGVARLRAAAAARRRGRRRHHASRDVSARARARALERRLRAAVAAAGRRPLRREPEPARSSTTSSR